MENRIYLFNSLNYFDIFYKDNEKRGIVLVVPGGGYDHTSLKESMSVVNAFKNAGFHAALLKYREECFVHPTPLKEIAYCVDYLKKLDLVLKDKVILIGFSAGGHMVANLANHYMEFPEFDARPSLCILSYPVVTTNPKYMHKGSFLNLLKDEYTKENLLYNDIALNVHEYFPPTFVWHTRDDNSVNIMNTMLLIESFIKNDILFEYHIFPSGVHGLSMATEESAMGDIEKVNPYVSKWFNMALDFIFNTLK